MDHLLKTDGLTKPTTPKDSIKKIVLSLWNKGDLTWGTPTYKVTWSFNHLVLWDHGINWIVYIATYRIPLNTKLGKVLTYHEMLGHFKPYVINLRLPANLKKLNLFHKTYGY